MEIDMFYDPKELGLVVQFDYRGERVRVHNYKKIVDVASVANMRWEMQEKMKAIDKVRDPEIMADVLMELSVFEGKLAMSSTKRQTIKYYNETADKILQKIVK